MLRLTPEMVEDLHKVADKHGLLYSSMIDELVDSRIEEDRKEDIRYRLLERFDMMEDQYDDDFVDHIYQRFVKAEDSNFSLWENIDNAIQWIFDGT